VLEALFWQSPHKTGCATKQSCKIYSYNDISSTRDPKEAMGKTPSNSWTDEQPGTILAETGNWVVDGRRGQALCLAVSLGRAMVLSAEHASEGAEISSLSRFP
jgi:hypothetical protein